MRGGEENKGEERKNVHVGGRECMKGYNDHGVDNRKGEEHGALRGWENKKREG